MDFIFIFVSLCFYITGVVLLADIIELCRYHLATIPDYCPNKTNTPTKLEFSFDSFEATAGAAPVLRSLNVDLNTYHLPMTLSFHGAKAVVTTGGAEILSTI